MTAMQTCIGRKVVFAIFVCFLAISSASAQTQLFSQSAEAAFSRDFPSTNLSYLLMDTSGIVLAERWSGPDVVAPGSLVKPFLALAYGEQHSGRFPKVRCLGTQSRCWLPRGHGYLGLEEAIANSCNAYFLELASSMDSTKAAQTFARYGLTGPPATATASSLVGLGGSWVESPPVLAKAFLQLVNERQSPMQGRIVMGMSGSASYGTARAVDSQLGRNAALAKTGTALCLHASKAAADGFTVILYPALQPRILLLVRVHGSTGAASAQIAASMLRSLGDGE
ncbi:MAG: penicillin-binding transpeptidase domain-containing protein [Terracidiphilus sp.]